MCSVISSHKISEGVIKDQGRSAFEDSHCWFIIISRSDSMYIGTKCESICVLGSVRIKQNNKEYAQHQTSDV